MKILSEFSFKQELQQQTICTVYISKKEHGENRGKIVKKKLAPFYSSLLC